MQYIKRALEEINASNSKAGTSRKGAIYHQGRLLKQPSIISVSEGGFPLLTNRLVCDPESIHEQLDCLQKADFPHARKAFKAKVVRRMSSPEQFAPHALALMPKMSPRIPKPIVRSKSRQLLSKEQHWITSKKPHLGD